MDGPISFVVVVVVAVVVCVVIAIIVVWTLKKKTGVLSYYE